MTVTTKPEHADMRVKVDQVAEGLHEQDEARGIVSICIITGSPLFALKARLWFDVYRCNSLDLPGKLPSSTPTS